MSKDVWLQKVDVIGYDGSENRFVHSFMIPIDKSNEFATIWEQWKEEEGSDEDTIDDLIERCRDAGIVIYNVAWTEEYEWGYI